MKKVKKNREESKSITFLLCLVIVYSVAILGSLIVGDGANSEWYLNIKPSITPPNYVFPIVWNLLFLLIAIALYFSWTASDDGHEKTRIAAIFGTNFLLNIMWSLFYFALHQPLIAFADIILLLFSTGIIIAECWDRIRISSYLLLPYFIWLLFAAILNLMSV